VILFKTSLSFETTHHQDQDLDIIKIPRSSMVREPITKRYVNGETVTKTSKFWSPILSGNLKLVSKLMATF